MSDIDINFMTNSILHIHQFSWVFLVDLLMIIALSVFSLFYFNQLLGFIVTHTVGWYLWYQYGVYLKIQSIQISLLGGRVMFRNVAYVGTSQSVHIVYGSLSWKYWLADRRRSRLLNAQNLMQQMAQAAKRRAMEAVARAQQAGDLSKDARHQRQEEAKIARKEARDTRHALRVAEETHADEKKLAAETRKIRMQADAAKRAVDECPVDETVDAGIDSTSKSKQDNAGPSDDFQPSTTFDEVAPGQSAFMLKLHGVEWFIYNREYAYEALNKPEAPLDEFVTKFRQGLSSTELRVAEILPLQIDIHQFGVVLGNEDTESLVVISVPSTNGTVDMAPASNKTDRYMVQVDIDFSLLEVTLRANPDYHTSAINSPTTRRQKRYFWAKKKAAKQEEWLGLKRYGGNEANNSSSDADSSTDDVASHENVSSGPPPLPPVEYAKVTQVLACDYAKAKMCVDAVGLVDPHAPPPLYDIQMEIRSAKLTYGPHAERQRQTFFEVFFPRNCTNSTPQTENISKNSAESTSTGQSECEGGVIRKHPNATVNVKLLGESALVIPVREESKDSQFMEAFTKHWKAFGGSLQRSYGWLELRAEENSRVDVCVPFERDVDGGFHTKCALNLVTPYIRTSVNHDTMLRASTFKIHVDLHQPAVWNAVNTFTIRNEADQLDCFILREHMNLIDDALTDFSSGPVVPYELFTPSVYVMTLDIRNLRLFLNVNKGNIINSPTSISENTFLVLQAPEISVVWDIPHEDIASPTNKILTLIMAPHVDLNLSAPNWHTLQEFLDTKRLATVESFSMKLEHHNTTLVSEKTGQPLRDPIDNASRLINTQILEVCGSQLVFLAHGFFIDYIMRIRENYFGHQYHFKTTEEFLRDTASKKSQDSIKSESFGASKTLDHSSDDNVNNEFPPPEGSFSRDTPDSDSQMRIRVDKGVFLIPTRLYSTAECVALQFVALDIECRFTNYYMDLQAEVAPILGRLLRGMNPGTVHEEARQASFSEADFSISSLGVHAHRMFGLPPSEPTYVVRWDFEVGDISANYGFDAVLAVDNAVNAFLHSMNDDENKPVMPVEDLFDVTFITVKIQSAAVVRPAEPVESDDSCKGRVEILASTITIKGNDLCNKRYSGKRTIEIPHIQVRGYAGEALVLECSTAIYVTNFSQKPHMDQRWERQQQHIAFHDSMFHRASFLLNRKHRSTPPFKHKASPTDFRVCIPLPNFPPPLTHETISNQFMTDGLFSESSFTSHDSTYESIDTEDSFTDATSDNRRRRNETPMPSESRYPFNKDPLGCKESEVFPFACDTVSDSREWLRSRRAYFNLKPRPWRANAPHLEVNQEFDNTSVVIQVMPIHTRVTPQAALIWVAFNQSNPLADFEAQLDSLQIRMLAELLKASLIPEIARSHVIIPQIKVQLSESMTSQHGVQLEINGADLMYSTDFDQKRGVHGDFESLVVTVRQGHAADFSQLSAVSFTISKLDLWWQQTSKRESTGSIEMSGVDFSFVSDKVEWALHYIFELALSVPRLPAKKVRHKTKQDLLKATVYALTMAGEEMGVEQDSYVLSRPSGAVQSRGHVRSKISWRILMRLRYLLHRIPPAERVALQSAIQSGEYEVPSNAKEQLLEIYRHWRSWEQSMDLDNTEVFKLVFDDVSFQEFVLSLSSRFEVLVESMVCRAVYPDGHDHFIGTSGLEVYVTSRKLGDVQEIDLNFTCQQIRALGGLDLIALAVTILLTLKQEQKNFADELNNRKIATDSDEEDNIESLNASIKTNRSQDSPGSLKTNVSVFLLDLIVEFRFDTITVETQLHQVQFAANGLVNDNIAAVFHSGTLITANGAFRVLKPDRADVIDALVSGVQIGYVVRGTETDGNVWVSMDIEAASLATHRSIEQILNMVIDFLMAELPGLRKVGEKLDMINSRKFSAPTIPIYQLESKYETTEGDEEPGDEADEEPLITGGRFFNVTVRSMKLRARLVDEFKLVWHGREFATRLRIGSSPEAIAIVTAFDVQRSSTGIHFGDGSASIVSLHLDNIRSVLHYRRDGLIIFNKVASLAAETMSLVWILEYVRRHRVDAQLSRVKQSINKVVDLLGSENSKEPQPTIVLPAPSAATKFRIRFVNRVAVVSLKLPLDKSPLNLKIDNVYLIREQLEEAGTFKLKAGIDDCVLEMLSLRRSTRRLAHLKFVTSIEKQAEAVLVNVESDYIRLAFDPDAIGAIYLAMQKLESYSSIFNEPLTPGATPVVTPEPEDVDKSQKVHEAVKQSLESSLEAKTPDIFAALAKLRLYLSLKQFTVSWYTNAKSTTGFTIGYEQFTVRVSRLAANVELSDAYLIPSDTSTKLPKNRMNAIHLPLLEAKAVITTDNVKKPLITTKISGESVTVSIMPSVGPWALALIDSVTDTARMINKLSVRRPAKISSPEQTSTVNSQLNIPFDFQIDSGFDRSILKLFDEEARKGEPALELLSPEIKIKVEFVESHLMIRIDASQTTNTMYPKALSEIRALSSLTTAALKRRALRLARESSSTPEPFSPSNYLPLEEPMSLSQEKVPSETPTTSETNDFFGQLELDMHVHFDSQELHLSSQPYSKVGAQLAVDGVDVLFVSPRGSQIDRSYLSLHGLVKRARMSLQHVYSREISASVEISRFSAAGMYRYDEPTKLALDISKLAVDLDLSKLHDMRIFFDVWTLYTASSQAVPAVLITDSDENERANVKRPRGKGRSANALLASSLLGPALFSDDYKPQDDENSKHDGSGSGSSAASLQSQEELLIDKYKNAVSQLPLMYIINFSIRSVDVKVGMGASIGSASISVGRLWLALMKASAFDQMLNVGIGKVSAVFEGRLTGALAVDGIMAKMAIHIRESYRYPLIHSKVRLAQIGFSLGLDFHPFVAGEVTALSAVLTTQGRQDVAEDRVHLSITCDFISLVITALFAVHAHDVLSLFRRLQSQISLAPIFMSAEAAQETATRSSERQKRRRERVARLAADETIGMRVLLNLRLGEILVHILPTDFSDGVALKAAAQKVDIHLDRQNLKDTFKIGFDLALDECMISLANTNGGGYKKSISELDYVDFLKYMRMSSNGSVIVCTPEITIVMDTTEYKSQPQEVFYTFSNEIHGSVDFGWNFGSVNFIKEMINAHKDAMVVRQDMYEATVELPETGNPSAKALREAAANIERSASLRQATSPKTAQRTPTPEVENQPTSANEVVFMGTRYIAQSTPMISIPQIRDLGDATPPIEWIGVNRQRIPMIIHHYFTRRTADAASEIEKLILMIIGQMD